MSETSKKQVREFTEPTPETMRYVPDEPLKGGFLSRLEAAKERIEYKEERQFAEKLRGRKWHS
jgi:hypothetical protein